MATFELWPEFCAVHIERSALTSNLKFNTNVLYMGVVIQVLHPIALVLFCGWDLCQYGIPESKIYHQVSIYSSMVQHVLVCYFLD